MSLKMQLDRHASGWCGTGWRDQKIKSTVIWAERQLPQQACSHLPPNCGFRAKQLSPSPERRRDRSPSETAPDWETHDTAVRHRTRSSWLRQAYSMRLRAAFSPKKRRCFSSGPARPQTPAHLSTRCMRRWKPTQMNQLKWINRLHGRTSNVCSAQNS